LVVEKGHIDHYEPVDPLVAKDIKYRKRENPYTVLGMQIMDVAIIPDRKHAIVIGEAITNHEELQPMLTRKEKRVAGTFGVCF